MENTVIILGAGASVDYGYPTGLELTESISDHGTIQAAKRDLDKHRQQLQNYSQLATGLSRIDEHFFMSRDFSIDSWLAREENRICSEAGKFLITLLIARRERAPFTRENFFRLQGTDRTERRNDWYRHLSKAMKTDTFGEFGAINANLTIVTFNYDRSLEYYLINAIKHGYPGHSDEDYKRQLKKINIFHIYGHVGELPEIGDGRIVPYGVQTDFLRVLKRSEGLRIIPELREADNPTIGEIRNGISKASNIFFVGFGYDAENLNLLGFPIQSDRNDIIKISGTFYKMEEAEIEIAKTQVKVIHNNGQASQIKPYPDCDAYKFFRRVVIGALNS